jgi:outer membrane lipoprotein LolB
VVPTATHAAARRHALLAFSLLLAGCAVPATRPADTAARPPRALITAFALDGRLAVRNGEARYSANVSWRHSIGHDDILLSGPLGQGLAELVRDDSGARLTLSDHRQVAAADLDQLSAQVFGVALPLTDMARWVLGDAGNGNAAAPDDPQRPLQMTVRGWTIELLDWESAASGALPTMIDIHRDELGARLKVVEWQDVR